MQADVFLAPQIEQAVQRFDIDMVKYSSYIFLIYRIHLISFPHFSFIVFYFFANKHVI